MTFRRLIAVASFCLLIFFLLASDDGLAQNSTKKNRKAKPDPKSQTEGKPFDSVDDKNDSTTDRSKQGSASDLKNDGSGDPGTKRSLNRIGAPPTASSRLGIVAKALKLPEMTNATRLGISKIPISKEIELPKKPNKIDRPSIKKTPEVLTKKEPLADYPEMIQISGGSFDMGFDEGQPDEAPVHKVEISSFEIGKYEITNHQFRVFVKATGYKTTAHNEGTTTWEVYGPPGCELYPVVMVTWDDAMEYCNWLSKVTGANYRLPTEAEWEFAARGGIENRMYPWGNDLDFAKANCAADKEGIGNLGSAINQMSSIGSYEPNGFGLYDIIGNVSEWCYDWYEEDYYTDSPEKNPMGPETGLFIYRVTRGGSWTDPFSFSRVTFRNAATIPYRFPSIGFRVVKVTEKTAIK
jgi:formylglycine-generating enzyme